MNRYHKCAENPSVQTFHIADNQQDKQNHPDVSTFLIGGLKVFSLGLIGLFGLFALPFLFFKALFLPFKFFLLLKAFTLMKTFFLLNLFFRFLRFNRRPGGGNNGNNNFLGFSGKHKHKLQTIKDILNGEDAAEEDIDYKSDEEDVISKESVGSPMLLDNPFNSTDSEQFVQNLVKLIKLKNKKW